MPRAQEHCPPPPRLGLEREAARRPVPPLDPHPPHRHRLRRRRRAGNRGAAQPLLRHAAARPLLHRHAAPRGRAARHRPGDHADGGAPAPHLRGDAGAARRGRRRHRCLQRRDLGRARGPRGRRPGASRRCLHPRRSSLADHPAPRPLAGKRPGRGGAGPSGRGSDRHERARLAARARLGRPPAGRPASRPSCPGPREPKLADRLGRGRIRAPARRRRRDRHLRHRGALGVVRRLRPRFGWLHGRSAERALPADLLRGRDAPAPRRVLGQLAPGGPDSGRAQAAARPGGRRRLPRRQRLRLPDALGGLGAGRSTPWSRSATRTRRRAARPS